MFLDVKTADVATFYFRTFKTIKDTILSKRRIEIIGRILVFIFYETFQHTLLFPFYQQEF